MEESLQTLVSSQVHTEPLETSHHIPKKEFLRKRTKNFHNFYGDSYEGTYIEKFENFEFSYVYLL